MARANLAALGIDATLRTPSGLAVLLAEAPTPGLERRWEGELNGTDGSTRGVTIRLAMRLMLAGNGLMEGTGEVGGETASLIDTRFSLSGSRDGNTAEFQLWFAAMPFARQPFACAGQLAADNREITGEWSLGCVLPEDCDCSGGSGTFRLWRTD